MDPNSDRLFACDFEVVHKGLKTPHGFQFILYCSDLCELTCPLCFIPDNPEFLHIGFPSSLHHLGIFLVEILLLPEMGIAYRGDFRVRTIGADRGQVGQFALPRGTSLMAHLLLHKTL